MQFQTVNELYLKVTNDDNTDTIVTKLGAFIGGSNFGQRNYKFEKLLLGPQNSIGQAVVGSVVRRITGENVPLTKVTLNGSSTTYYSSNGQHVVCYKLKPGEMISIESENLLAFTSSCAYSVRFLGVGVISQKGFVITTLTGTDDNSLVAFLSEGNPMVLTNTSIGLTLSCDPDSVIGWIGEDSCDPDIKLDTNWKTFVAQASGETYMFEWSVGKKVTVLLQPTERTSGVDLGIDSGKAQINPQQSINQQVEGIQNSIQNAGQILENVKGITNLLNL